MLGFGVDRRVIFWFLYRFRRARKFQSKVNASDEQTKSLIVSCCKWFINVFLISFAFEKCRPRVSRHTKLKL